MSSFRGQLVPAEIILSPDTYQNITEEIGIRQGTGGCEDSLAVLRSYLSLPVTIREKNTDVIVAKELHPNPCPVCGRRIPFLREMIERIESRSVKRIRCPLGHRYDGEIRIYHLNVFQEHRSVLHKPIEVCPQCGSKNVQYLSRTDVFCFDCEWDNLKPIPDP